MSGAEGQTTVREDVTPNEDVREKRDQDTRRCDVCKEPVAGGLEEMAEHIADHDPEDIAQEASHVWSPAEPLAFHHPTGKTHFMGGSHSDNWVETLCGNAWYSSDLPDGVTVGEATSYDHADEDEYCGSCINLWLQKYGNPQMLPAPLEGVSR